MALQKRFKVAHGDVFPMGAYMKGSVEAVADFTAPQRQDGSRPQQLDKDTGLPLWQVTVLDADDEAGKRDTAVTVKLAARVQPTPPENPTGTPWRPVEFVGLTALAWVDYGGGKDREGRDRARVAWSFKAEDIMAPGEAKKPGGSASGGSGSRAA
ncbi:plasmid replication, integration and excision activator [Microlunatus elymi]|uniref:Plasmid replication, integration and excision activator n=2 Tax=Microlunatus elymi TaxID=2596828 RepID=A0A516Q5A6_9ACTN|nr:plasmid replication, integration and excision activator [Microlunatus elymi]